MFPQTKNNSSSADKKNKDRPVLGRVHAVSALTPICFCREPMFAFAVFMSACTPEPEVASDDH